MFIAGLSSLPTHCKDILGLVVPKLEDMLELLVPQLELSHDRLCYDL